MYLKLNEMQELNRIQLDIFKAFVGVCDKLGLKYYMAHGSLLGTLRNNGFIPFDDDIDLLMPRKDYDILLQKGQQLLPEEFFIQAFETEKEYPLAFAKIRNSNTAFIQPIMGNFNINQGIYIDIFPMDYYPRKALKQKLLKFMDKVYMARINIRMNYADKRPLFKRLIMAASVVFCPSWEKAVNKRASLYKNIEDTGLLVSVGGKGSEKGMPAKWFAEGRPMLFEGIEVNCPLMTEEYLTRIYGDYMNFDPTAEYMDDSGKVKVSADRYSTTESYIELIK